MFIVEMTEHVLIETLSHCCDDLTRVTGSITFTKIL